MTHSIPRQFLRKKKRHAKIVMLTAYDFPLASFIDQCGVDIILVGDSLANVVLGLKSTREVNMEIMLHHTKAVRRAVKNAFLVGDMPYGSYEESNRAIKNAKRFIKEAGCDAVKIEWFAACPKVARTIVKAGIPLMGHVGLTPQTATSFKVQGRDPGSARRIMEQARLLEKAGCFSIVLECIPDKIAALITNALKIPTIGIGAGPHCDGQVLVSHDVLGLSDTPPPFAKPYAQLSEQILSAARAYIEDVRAGSPNR